MGKSMAIAMSCFSIYIFVMQRLLQSRVVHFFTYLCKLNFKPVNLRGLFLITLSFPQGFDLQLSVFVPYSSATSSF